ncbi:hypothetical protein K490DRAFT_9085, partial [Saccharata proteae CBS 121410]
VSYAELAQLEREFDDADLQIIRQQYALQRPLFDKRQAFVAKIPGFWALVLEQVPPEVDQYIQPSDSQALIGCLQTLDVVRFEVDDPKGSPRSFSIKFGFSENNYFENKVLEKKFWWRRAADGWVGYVSEPVRIQWKEGRDLSGGLTEAAWKLWEAKQKLAKTANGNAKEKEMGLKEYSEVVRRVEESDEGSLSFFAWFSFVGNRPFVSAEESVRATELVREIAAKTGDEMEEVDDGEEEDLDDILFNETEVFPNGDELAQLLAEDVFPGAIKYFISAQEGEEDDEDLSEIDDEDIPDDESDE